MATIYYCPKCSHIVYGGILNKIGSKIFNTKYSISICENCNSKLIKLQSEHTQYKFLNHECEYYSNEWFESRNQFIKDVVSKSSEFDDNTCNSETQKLLEKANILQQVKDEHEKKVKESADADYKAFLNKQKNAPKCPTCGSTNIGNISTLNRAVSVGAVGLASGKIGKTRKCNNCGYMW